MIARIAAGAHMPEKRRLSEMLGAYNDMQLDRLANAGRRWGIFNPWRVNQGEGLTLKGLIFPVENLKFGKYSN